MFNLWFSKERREEWREGLVLVGVNSYISGWNGFERARPTSPGEVVLQVKNELDDRLVSSGPGSLQRVQRACDGTLYERDESSVLLAIEDEDFNNAQPHKPAPSRSLPAVKTLNHITT